MVILLVLPFLDPKHSMASTIFMPSFALPKTTHLPSNHSVLAVQMKNGTVCVGASIYHGQGARTCMLSGWNSHHKISCHRWTCHQYHNGMWSLAHKSRNYSVKAGNFITKSFLPSALSMKVFCCLWNFACKQLERDMAQGLAVDTDVKEEDEVDRGWTAQETLGWQHLQGLK